MSSSLQINVEAWEALERGDMSEAALKFAAQETTQFEEAALELMHDPMALIQYLEAKMASLPRSAKIQRALLCSYLVEIFKSAGATEAELAKLVPELADPSVARVIKQVSSGSERSAFDIREQEDPLKTSTSVAALAYELKEKKEKGIHIPTNPDDDDPAMRQLVLETTGPPEDLTGWSMVDLQHALRVADDEQKIRVFEALGMREQAVKQAAKISPERARQVLANRQPDETLDEDEAYLEKRLALSVAKTAVSAQDSSFLNECPSLSIQDVLPFYPDFVVVDAFKSEISASLRDYETSIQAVKRDLDEYAKSLQAIRSETALVAARDLKIRPENARCALSGLPLTLGPFHVFSSGLAYLDSVLKQVYAYHRPLMRPGLLPDVYAAGASAVDERGDPRPPLYPDCPLTGQIMIESITLPLDHGFSLQDPPQELPP